MGARDPVRDGVVHGLVREHFAAFAERMQEGGRALPRCVIGEFESFLRCGVLACGFMRARCAGCGHDRLVAFSCKHRGVCSSCGGRRMSETAARQRDRVLPGAPYRQWVLSLPWALRLPVARDPALLNAVSRVFFEEVRAWLRATAGTVAGARVEAAAITFVQRFGGSLNLNPHLHMLVADGVFACLEDGSTPRFVATGAPTCDELRGVIARVIARLETIAARRARRTEGAGGGDASDDGIEGLRQAAIGRGTFARIAERGAREGERESDDARANAPLRLASRGLVAEMDGFNLHAGVRLAADDRDGLERLCR